jgi:hypothetical protein
MTKLLNQIAHGRFRAEIFVSSSPNKLCKQKHVVQVWDRRPSQNKDEPVLLFECFPRTYDVAVQIAKHCLTGLVSGKIAFPQMEAGA